MHLQDQLLLAEALIAYTGDVRDLSPRERRAWELADEMLFEANISREALVTQVDERWSGCGE